MSMKTEATVLDLCCVEGKAEIVNGEVVHMSPVGVLSSYAAGEIFISLREYAKCTGSGRAVGDNAALIVNLPQRKSFSDV